MVELPGDSELNKHTRVPIYKLSLIFLDFFLLGFLSLNQEGRCTV